MIPAWIIISLILTIVLIVLLRTTNHIYILSLIKENFFYFFAIALFIFLAISLTHINSKYDIDLKTSEGMVEAAKIYLSWAGNVMSNVGKVTSYAINQEWFEPGNSTKQTKPKK